MQVHKVTIYRKRDPRHEKAHVFLISNHCSHHHIASTLRHTHTYLIADVFDVILCDVVQRLLHLHSQIGNDRSWINKVGA